VEGGYLLYSAMVLSAAWLVIHAVSHLSQSRTIGLAFALIAWAYVAAVVEKIELVPSVIVTPSRQTVLLAKQLATLERLSGGGVRLGVGVGGSEAEYRALGQDFGTRGARCEEQLELLRRLWAEPEVDFEGRWDVVQGTGIDPLPSRPIPIWIGARGLPATLGGGLGADADVHIATARRAFEELQELF